jgi:hypothetical protein
MKTNLPVKYETEEIALKQLEKKEKIKQIEEELTKKDGNFIKAFKLLMYSRNNTKLQYNLYYVN